MKIDEIVEAIRSDRVNITRHARKEAKNDLLILDKILFSTIQGEIIEDYPDDKPYPSCLIYGETPEGEPIHIVWGYDCMKRIAILITVYRPDFNLWDNWKERSKI